MSTIEEALYNLLTSDSGLNAVVGSRIYAVQLEQNPTYPAQVLTKIHVKAHETLLGAYGLDESIWQLDSFGKTHAEARAAARAGRIALEGYRGTVLGVQIGGCQFEGDHDNNFEAFPEIFMICSRFRVWYRFS